MHTSGMHCRASHENASGLAPEVPAICSDGVEWQKRIAMPMLQSVRGP
jgi:hypothetical protein